MKDYLNLLEEESGFSTIFHFDRKDVDRCLNSDLIPTHSCRGNLNVASNNDEIRSAFIAWNYDSERRVETREFEDIRGNDGVVSIFFFEAYLRADLDTGVREGDEVTPNYDPMLAKLIVWAPSRPKALQKMRRALDEFVVLGTTTNIEFLRDLCDATPVIDGSTTTTTIDDLWPNGWSPPAAPMLEEASLLAAASAETLGLHRRTSTGSSDDAGGPPSPFTTIQRRFP